VRLSTALIEPCGRGMPHFPLTPAILHSQDNAAQQCDSGWPRDGKYVSLRTMKVPKRLLFLNSLFVIHFAVLLAILLPPIATASPDSVVVFNELHYHPPGNEEEGTAEWVELHNQMGIMTDVSGWKLVDGVEFTIPKGTIIPPKGYLIISSKPADDQLGPFTGALANAGERIQLFNHSDRLMDEMTYEDGGRWPVAPDGSGVTLAKSDSNTASGPAENWTWSAQTGGTPGSANFPDADDIELTTVAVLEQGATWRYNEAGADLGTDWATSTHPVGDAWKEGAGVFAFEPALDDPIGTALSFPALNDPFVTTYYFETDLLVDAATLERIDHLILSHLVDDGAAFYVNGTEVSRYNLPAGELRYDTLADGTEAEWIEGLRITANTLQAGTNRISVELHQERVGSSDVVFGARLSMALRPPSMEVAQSTLRFNEIAPAVAGAFWIELKNDGATEQNAGGMVISVSADAAREITIADGTTVAPGEYLLLPAGSFPFDVGDSDRLFLFNASRSSVIDARAASRGFRGRDETANGEWEGRWLTPISATPGAANDIGLNDAVVINEVFYNGPAQVAQPGKAPTLEPEPLFGFDQTWRYDGSGNDLGQGWATASHPDWPSGKGLLGFDGREFDDPLMTEFPPPASIRPFVVTHYFETDLSISAVELARTDSLQLWHYVDDGAVFYVNGIEVERYNMPASGEIDATTLASDGGEAERRGIINVPASLLVAGVNRISAEVHQGNVGSSDVIFGAEAVAQRIVDNGVPAIPYIESDEQWVELLNRSNAAIDLSGWQMTDGIRFTFPAGSMLSPGQYAVITSDAEAFAQMHPGVQINGEFSGNLSRSGERLELVDSLGNPVDTLHYYDGGRWPDAADGGGSSLELRDPDASNQIAESWAASDETGAAGWQTFRYRGEAARSTVGQDTQWRDFCLGLLFAGEILIDDISVIEEPDAEAEQLISNVDFTNNDTDWRLLGNHMDSQIITDPDSPGNNVLHVVATGPTEHMHNHIESTLGSRISNGREYEISFRAKWISGCNQLHTRLYFNRLARVNVIDRPLTGGTPGADNSSHEPNIGPAFTNLIHSPAVPAVDEPTTIRATAVDPDGIAAMTLWYSVNDATFESATMTPNGAAGEYQTSVPGQAASAIVHFYVEAEDGASAVSHHPVNGAQARAAYKVDDDNAETNGLQNFRIIVTNADRDWMHQDINVMSNGRIPATVIVDEETIFYDVGVRLKGSERARSQSPRVGFNVRFNADEKFRGIHDTVSIDRSEGTGTGQLEILFDVMIANSGGNISRYYDLIQIISPQDRHVGGAVLQLARYEDIFIDSQFGDGSAGTRYEYELIYYPTSADANGYKRPQPDSVVGTSIRDIGDDEEDYRWNFAIKDDREEDNFEPIMDYARHFSKSSAAFEEGLEEVVDVDNWLRGMAYAVMSGAGDNAGAGSQHNGMYYARPDGRVMFLPHDMDFAFDANRSITANPEVAKIVRIPRYARIYYGHLQDIAETTFNRDYMEQWTDHFNSFLPRQRWSSHLTYINSRSGRILSQIRSNSRAGAPIDFALGSPAPLTTDASSIEIEGVGWVNVRRIQLAGSDEPLEVDWTDETDWKLTLPVSPGSNLYTLEAVDFNGNILGSIEVAITGTGSLTPASVANLQLSELHYHPADLSQAEIDAGIANSDQFEFIELVNTSNGTIDLSGVRFTNGVAFTFPQAAQLAAGERALLVQDTAAFQMRYPQASVTGSFAGSSLANSGERLTLVNALGQTITDVRYNDKAPWPVDADGTGYSLVFSNGDPDTAQAWRPSATVGGTPATDDAISFESWKTENGITDDNSDSDLDGSAAVIEYAAGTSPAQANGVLFVTANQALIQFPVSLTSEGIPLLLEVSNELTMWRAVTKVEATFEGLLHNRDDATAIATWKVETTPAYFRLSAKAAGN
jgi:hypothetical protein